MSAPKFEELSPTMQRAVIRNQNRVARHKKAERLLRRLRQRIFDYDDEGPAKAQKATRLMERCKARCMPTWEAEAKTREAANIHHILVSRGAD